MDPVVQLPALHLDRSGCHRGTEEHHRRSCALPQERARAEEVGVHSIRYGIVTPVVTRTPGGHARWEREAGIEEIARAITAAERLGYDHATCSEHVAIPRSAEPVRGATYWDPLATFGYVAAHTSTIRFVTYVLVLGYHHPLEIAKRYGTLDRICGGRLVLGVGVGTLHEEFELLEAPFDDRGARGDDALRALRSSFGRREPEYDGPYYSYRDFVVEPHGVQLDVPIWVGGRTARSLRRAVELGDAWCPFSLELPDVAGMLHRARETDAWRCRTAPLDVVLPTVPPLDPIGDPQGTRERVAGLRQAGATIVSARFVHHSIDHFGEQLAALPDVVEFDRRS